MSDFFPIFDFIDIFWTPWSTPQDYIWNGKIVLMGFFVSASCQAAGFFQLATTFDFFYNSDPIFNWHLCLQVPALLCLLRWREF